MRHIGTEYKTAVKKLMLGLLPDKLDVGGSRKDGICTVGGYYAASSGNPLLTFRENISFPFFFLHLLTL
jgi:hypothetical protein